MWWTYPAYKECEELYYKNKKSIEELAKRYNTTERDIRNILGVADETDIVTKEECITEKQKLIDYINNPELTTARNRMGCSENWYNPYYAIMNTFNKETILKMTDKEIVNLVALANNIGEAFW